MFFGLVALCSMLNELCHACYTLCSLQVHVRNRMTDESTDIKHRTAVQMSVEMTGLDPSGEPLITEVQFQWWRFWLHVYTFWEFAFQFAFFWLPFIHSRMF
jgi:hypothetical protein